MISLVISDVQCQLFPYKHKYSMSIKTKTCGEVDHGNGKGLGKFCVSCMLEKGNLIEIRKYFLGPTTLQIKIFS